MIFLAITSLLFVMIAMSFSGQAGRTQFSTAARDIESQIRDIANDVSTGFYPTSNDFTCTDSFAGPRIDDSTPSDQGTNQDCIYLGRVVHFRVNGNGENYNVYTVVGSRQVDGRDVGDYDEARPTTDSILTEQDTLPNGVSAGYVRSKNSNTPLNGIGYFGAPASTGSGSSEFESGSLGLDVIPITGGSPVPVSQNQMIGFVNNDLNQTYVTLAKAWLNEGLEICLNSGTSNQHAILSLGDSGSQLTTDLEIKEGSC